MGKSKSITVGYWYYPAFHDGLTKGPIDALLEYRGANKTAWQGELTASGAIAINNPNLWGGEKDQGGMVGTLRLMMGEADQEPNAYLTSVFGDKTTSWRGFCTVAWEGGKYGAMNPWPQNRSYKIRTIESMWDDGECWYPEKARIVLAPGEADAEGIEFSYSGGASFPSEANVAIGAAAGTIYLDFATGPNPDKFEVWVAGEKVLDTGYHGKGALVNPLTGNTYQVDLDNYMVSHGLPTEAINDIPSSDLDANTQWDNGNYETASFSKTTPAAIATVKVFSPLAGTIWKAALRRDAVPGTVGRYAMNPAHILVFLRTQRELGREAIANINTASAQAAADWFYANGFGLCTKRPAATESPASAERRICRVAGCSFTRSLVDGQWYIDIANGQYDLESLPILTDNDVLSFTRTPAVLDNAINSVAVRYFDVAEKQFKTTPPIRAMSLVNAFGENHKTYEYPEIPDGVIALRVAARELAASTTPRDAFDLATTRVTYAWRPSKYFRMQLPKRGIADMVCLVAELQHGKLNSGAIKLTATQEPASLPLTTYTKVESGVDTRPSQTPVAITVQKVFEAPYIDVCTQLTSSELSDLSEDAGFLAAIAVDPAASRDFTLRVAPSGGDYVQYAAADFCPTAAINEAAPLDGTEAAPSTDFTFSEGKALQRVVVGMPCIWGEEWCRVDAIDIGAGTISLGRGCADTVPLPHAAGERIFFYADHMATDEVERLSGETVNAKVLTNTGSQQLAEADATPMSLTFDRRLARPYPPGKVLIDGGYYPSAVAGEFTVSWAHRNRQLQADQLSDTTMASVALASNTRYALRFLDAADGLLVEQLDIGSDTATVELNYTGDVTMELYTIDDIEESMLRHLITFTYTGTVGNSIDATAYTPVYDGIIVDGGA